MTEIHSPRFSTSALGVITRAIEEATRLRHERVGSEHLLLGLIAEGGRPAQILAEFGMTLEEARASVRYICGEGHFGVKYTGLAQSGRRVIERTVEEFSNSNETLVLPEHILLGVLRVSDGIAAGILESHKISLAEVRRRLVESMAG